MQVVRLTVLGVFLTAVCSLVVAATVIHPTSLSFPAAGGDGIVSVQYEGDGSLDVQSTVDWVHATGVTEIGTQQFATFTVESNDGPAREGNILVGDAVLRVAQDGLDALSASEAEPKRRFLAYCETSYPFEIDGYYPNSIDLETEPPGTDWIAPPPQGVMRLYGVIPFVDGNDVRVVLDELDDSSYVVAFAFGDDRDFTDNPAYSTRDGSIREPVRFTLTYSDGREEPYSLNVYYSIDFSRAIGAFRFHYYAEGLRVGQIELGGRRYLIAVQDTDADGLYSDSVDIGIVDVQDFELYGSPLTWKYDCEAFQVACGTYVIDEIHPAGTYLTVRAPGIGFITGAVLSESGTTVAGVSVALDGRYATTAYDDGWFALQVPEGSYEWLLVTAPGYIPVWYRLLQPVSTARDAQVEVELRRPENPTFGRVTLENKEAYHFLSGDRGEGIGGDLYFLVGEGEASLWANDWHQRGVVDLGEIAGDLCDVEVPKDEYDQYGVEAIVGHTYVSLAREGEEGHYIVMRVVRIGATSIVLDYCYR